MHTPYIYIEVRKRNRERDSPKANSGEWDKVEFEFK